MTMMMMMFILTTIPENNCCTHRTSLEIMILICMIFRRIACYYYSLLEWRLMIMCMHSGMPSSGNLLWQFEDFKEFLFFQEP